MRIIDAPQGTPEWLAARAGRVTASRIGDMIAKTKTGWGASRANYAAQLVAERLTGNVAESFTNAAMQWGTAMEPEAINAYQFYRDATVTRVGFVLHPAIDDAGASPDGLVGEPGLIECKCPQTATHIETLLGCSVPAKYEAQMQWQMACTGRAWCDYVSYDPRLPESMRLFVRRLNRDEKRIAELEGEVRTFLLEIARTVSELRKIYDEAA
jgi:putative phage-type endonuclease